MGQGGYGIDQAYLWYKRDGTKLDHDVQILRLSLMIFYVCSKTIFCVMVNLFWGSKMVL